MFSNALFSPAKSGDMKSDRKHPSFERLLSIAEGAGFKGPTALAGVLEQSEQVVNNWSRRGVSKAGAIAAQQKLGCSSNWVLDGSFPKMLTDEPQAKASPLAELIQRLSRALENVEAANRPLITHAIKTWADTPDQWELLAQQLRNLGVDMGLASPETQVETRTPTLAQPRRDIEYVAGKRVHNGEIDRRSVEERRHEQQD